MKYRLFPVRYDLDMRFFLALVAAAIGGGGADYAYAAEPVTPVPCQAGCTIPVPAIPERVLYYGARYLDTNGQTLVPGSLGAALVP